VSLRIVSVPPCGHPAAEPNGYQCRQSTSTDQTEQLPMNRRLRMYGTMLEICSDQLSTVLYGEALKAKGAPVRRLPGTRLCPITAWKARCNVESWSRDHVCRRPSA
jgi:hypothetical protein